MSRRYDVVIGTGGIGSGIFMALEGNRTLGREESRPADLLDQRDYCKLHIVCHYVRRLLGPDVPVLPIGRIGPDDSGRAVLVEMRAAGLDTALVKTSTRPTLFAVCFLYPDGDGGNVSTSRSASADVTADDVQQAAALVAAHPGRGVALALPEVPLAARQALLQLATGHGWLRVAAVVPDELPAVRGSGMLTQVDLLALNIEEAATLGGTSPGRPADEVVTAALSSLADLGSPAHVVVTAGARGSWTWDGQQLVHAPAADPDGAVVSTAGAGDAHLAGIVVALVAGLDLAAANAFASIVSALKVGSAHTINPDIDAHAVIDAAMRRGLALPPALAAILAGTPE
ncbi:MAG: PfkB family carbohydrate kinase [Actinomycetota bacterium]